MYTLHSKKDIVRYILEVLACIGLFIFSVAYLQLDFSKFVSRLHNVGMILSKMTHPDFSMFGEILVQLCISVLLGLASLLIACVISFFLAALAADNLTPNKYVSIVIKAIVSIIRAIPAMVWILMVVASIGFGNTGALLGLVVLSIGFLTKAFCTTFEDDGIQKVEALRSVGARWINIVIQGVANNTLPGLLTWIAITIETNIAMSISLGVLGISGIGYLLNKQIMKFNYPGISVIILTIFVSMLVVEYLVTKLKRYIHEK